MCKSRGYVFPSLLQNRHTLFLVGLGIFCMLAAPGLASASEMTEAWIKDTLHVVKEGTALPSGIKFRQNVKLRAFLLGWQFYSLMEQLEDGELHVETFNAPSFVPDTLPGELVSLGRSLALFEVKVVSYDPAEKLLHVAGPRPDYQGRGAKEGDFWIDVERGIVQKAEVVYNWGKLNVDQEYTTIDGLLVLSKQSARMRFYGATLEISYSDYIFP